MLNHAFSGRQQEDFRNVGSDVSKRPRDELIPISVKLQPVHDAKPKAPINQWDETDGYIEMQVGCYGNHIVESCGDLEGLHLAVQIWFVRLSGHQPTEGLPFFWGGMCVHFFGV